MSVFSSSTMNSEKVIEHIKSMGANLVGIGNVSIGLAEEFAHMPRGISIGMKHPSLKLKQQKIPLYQHLHQTIDKHLQEIQEYVTKELRTSGYKALSIPPDSYRHDHTFISRLYPLFPHKTAATCSGLGWVGKSGLLVTSEFGPRVSWATILTDAPIDVNSEPITASQCGDCKRCVNACPSEAISGIEWKRATEYHTMINVEKCSEQLAENFEQFGHYICGRCVLVCP